jgi:hypothetical protein
VTAAELPEGVGDRGFTLTAEGGGIRVRPSGGLTAADREAICARKGELLQLLRPAAPARDRAEAQRLLAAVHQAAEDVRQQEFGGIWPPDLGAVVGDLLAVAAGYVENLESEAARGWDALGLLRGVRPTLRQAVRNWKKRPT